MTAALSGGAFIGRKTLDPIFGKVAATEGDALEASTGAATYVTGGVLGYLLALSERLRRVRVCCGDWQRVLGPAVTTCIGTTGVFLDPPYHAPRTGRAEVYTHEADGLWEAVHAWAIANGDDRGLRIALCGYEGDHRFPKGWTEHRWKASGGYSRSERGKSNSGRERIWFSPHCLRVEQGSLDLSQ